MSEVQVRDEAMTLLLAGHETTANALGWTWHLLSRSPEVERELLEEVDLVLGGRPPEHGDLDRLTSTRRVFAEALRLYPPAWVLGRRAAEDTQLGGFRLRRGVTVLVIPYVLHRTARYYSDPERFDPARWTPEAAASRPPCSYLPFGGGPRNCIGESFAWMEGVLVLATLAREWRLRPAPGREAAIQPLLTLRPRGGLPMILERRRRPALETPASRGRGSSEHGTTEGEAPRTLRHGDEEFPPSRPPCLRDSVVQLPFFVTAPRCT